MTPNDPIALGFVVTATVSSFLMALSPLPVIYDVYQTKKVTFYRPDPFIAGIIFGTLNGAYSLYSGQFVSFISCMICGALYSMYLVVYVVYSKAHLRRGILLKLFIWLGLAVCIDAIGPVVAICLNKGSVLFVHTWLGVCACISVTLLFSGQLTNIAHVIRQKDARSISIFIMIGGLFSASMWTVYAVLVMDPYFLSANSLGVLAGIVQSILVVKYRKISIDVSVKDSLEEGPELPCES